MSSHFLLIMGEPKDPSCDMPKEVETSTEEEDQATESLVEPSTGMVSATTSTLTVSTPSTGTTSVVASSTAVTSTFSAARSAKPKSLDEEHGLNDELAEALTFLDTMDLEMRKSLSLLQLLAKGEDCFNLASSEPMLSSTRLPGRSTTFDANHNTASEPGSRLVVYDSRDKVKFRRFSGTIPIPNGEVSFQLWKLTVHPRVEACSRDEDEKHVREAMIDSLVPPALNAISHVRRSHPSVMLDLLETMFGSFDDHEELLLQFSNIVQDPKENASVYVKRLYLELLRISDLSLMRPRELDARLGSQFIRGCTDEDLLLKLRLDEKAVLGFAALDLLALVKTEEAKRLQKKAHLTQAKVHVHQAQEVPEEPRLSGLLSRLEALETRLSGTALSQQHSNSSRATSSQSSSSCTKPAPLPSSAAPANNGFPNFCFRCGVDGHNAVVCINKPNAQLVDEKVVARRVWRRGGYKK